MRGNLLAYLRLVPSPSDFSEVHVISTRNNLIRLYQTVEILKYKYLFLFSFKYIICMQIACYISRIAQFLN